MRKKYVVCPGYITSKHDGQRHYVDRQQLMDLYKVNKHECMDCGSKVRFEDQVTYLTPRYNGDYEEWISR